MTPDEEKRQGGKQSSGPGKIKKPPVFAKPPVKVACLSCRHSRVRCDGGEPCGGCVTKGKQCVYLKSRRGGPRKRRPKAMDPPSLATSTFDDSVFHQIDTLAIPGAGLWDLDFPAIDVQSMLEGLPLSPSNTGEITSGSGSVSAPSVKFQSPPQEPTRVRAYGSEDDILNGYYIFMHNYFPIFPPRFTPPVIDNPLDFPCGQSDFGHSEPSLPYLPQSPVSLAISAILALVPLPNDVNPSGMQSVLLRRSYSYKFARLAYEAVNDESELTESNSMPSQALQNDFIIPSRRPIHPRTPVELESILALLILCVYEYTQRGNLFKMQLAASSAHTMAMSMSLHALGKETDDFSEAKRRAWWMTFYCVCQGSIVSTKTPQVMPNDPRFITPLPTFSSDNQGWMILIKAQQTLVDATRFIIELNHTLRARNNMVRIHNWMERLDGVIKAVMFQAKKPNSTSSMGMHDYTSEEITAQSIRSISMIKLSSARIKIHRFRAFSDMPIFMKKHCDLTCASTECKESETQTTAREAENQEFSKLSCCGNFDQIPSTASAGADPFSWVVEESYPFSCFDSAMICMQSARTISEMFDGLPRPEVGYAIDGLDGTDAGSLLPRTMPSFACCAMQSSYAMLMLRYKYDQLIQQAEIDGQPMDAQELLGELYVGIDRVLGAVKNFSIAFEAMGGMKEEIENAFEAAFPKSAWHFPLQFQDDSPS